MTQTRFGEQACQKVLARLDSYIDNELLTESSLELMEHFQRCTACTRESQERRNVRARLQTASILAGVLYTGGPRPYGYEGLGEVFVFLFFGIVAVAQPEPRVDALVAVGDASSARIRPSGRSAWSPPRPGPRGRGGGRGPPPWSRGPSRRSRRSPGRGRGRARSRSRGRRASRAWRARRTPASGARHEASVHIRLYRDRVGLEAPAAVKRPPGLQIATHEDDIAVFLHHQRQLVERPRRVLERRPLRGAGLAGDRHLREREPRERRGRRSPGLGDRGECALDVVELLLTARTRR